MVDCSQFLDDYSAFRDGELDDEIRAHFEAHRNECRSCARYDSVINKGVDLYRKCPQLTPSDDFLPRLQHRLYNLEEEMRGPGSRGSGAQAALTLAIAATIAAIAWVPATRSQPAMMELPPVAARAPLPPASQPVIFQVDPMYNPAQVGLGNWRIDRSSAYSGDLFFSNSSSGTEFRVQPVLQRQR